MNERDYRIAKELKKRLSGIVHLVDFRVFGSRAKEEPDEYSDMDIFIEVDFLNKALKKNIRDITWEVGLENSIVISPLIFTRYEIENSPLKVSPIVKNINEEGVKL